MAIGIQLTSPESGWRRYDETENYFSYVGSGWSKVTGALTRYNGTETNSNVTGAKIRFSFYGTKLRLLDSTSTNRSFNIKATIDGNVEYYNAKLSGNTVPLTIVYEKTGLPLGRHNVELELITTDSTYLVLDAIDIDDTGYMISTVGSVVPSPEAGWKRYDENLSIFSYAGTGWTSATTANAYGGTVISTLIAGDSVKFNFKGTKLRIITAVNNQTGTSMGSNSVKVNIDGIEEAFSCYAPLLWKVISYEKLNLEDKIHTVQITNNQNNAVFWFDAVDIDDSGYIIDARENYSNVNSSLYVSNNNNLSSSLTIAPHGVMDVDVNVIAQREKDILSSVIVKNTVNLVSEINVYSNNVLENLGWGLTIYGNQRRSSINVLNRNDLQSKLQIAYNSKMSGVVDVIDPPIHHLIRNPVADTFLRQGIQTLNYGGSQNVQVGYSLEKNEIYRTLIKFDVTNLIDNITIKNIKLRLYNSQILKNPQKLALYSVSSAWDEYGATWKNQPYISDMITSSSVAGVGYVEFDVTSAVQKWINNEEDNYGFEIRALNESQDDFVSLNSRESSVYKPELDISYQENIIYTYNRTNISSKFYVLQRKDLASSIRIPSFNSDEYLKSKMFINRNDTFVSYIAISNPDIYSLVTVKVEEKNSINGNISVRNQSLSDLDSKLEISKLVVPSKISILYRDNVTSELVVRKYVENNINSTITVNKNSLLSRLFVAYSDDIDSSISVKQANYNDLESVIDIVNPNLITSLDVLYRDDLMSSIDVWIYGEYDLPSTISINRSEIKGTIKLVFKDQVQSSITVRRDAISQFSTKIAVSKPDMLSQLAVVYSNEIESSMVVRINKDDDLSSKLIVPYSKALNSKINVFNVNNLESTIKINSRYLKSTIVVRSYNNLNSSILIKARMASDLNTTITIGGTLGSYVFII